MTFDEQVAFRTIGKENILAALDLVGVIGLRRKNIDDLLHWIENNCTALERDTIRRVHLGEYEIKNLPSGRKVALVPGLFLYGGFGHGTYYSRDGAAVGCGSSEARDMAETEGSRYRYIDSLEGYTGTYLGD